MGTAASTKATTSKPITPSDIELAFAEAQASKLCSVGKIIAEHEHGDFIAGKVNDVLTYSAPTVSRVLKGLGIGPLSTEAVQKHRKGTCRCM